MKVTKVLKDEDGYCTLLLLGDANEQEMDLTVTDGNADMSTVTINGVGLLVLIEQLLEHNDMTIEDYKVGIESIRRQMPKD